MSQSVGQERFESFAITPSFRLNTQMQQRLRPYSNDEWDVGGHLARALYGQGLIPVVPPTYAPLHRQLREVHGARLSWRLRLSLPSNCSLSLGQSQRWHRRPTTFYAAVDAVVTKLPRRELLQPDQLRQWERQVKSEGRLPCTVADLISLALFGDAMVEFDLNDVLLSTARCTTCPTKHRWGLTQKRVRRSNELRIVPVCLDLAKKDHAKRFQHIYVASIGAFTDAAGTVV